ncbi:energy transducer TonB [Tenacibaculum aestuariivivum]|uniref:energy transducer TonB n=1 Tax=Tenacibaculum aestuariivivum TaxID=2006131 RepID=UPI003AB46FE1
MKIISLLMIIGTFSISIMSQEVCKSPDETDIDLNSISITKCTIKESKDKRDKKTRLISVKVSANRRNLKKREKSIQKEVSTLSGIGLSDVKNTIQKETIAKTISLKGNIEDVKNKLTIEELKNASKFSAVDKIPLFSACKKVRKNRRLDCFNENMVRHISKHFRYPSDAIKESIQGEVWVRFIIDKNGEVKNIKTLGPKNGLILNQEAIRVVSKLPQFVPAKTEGGRVSVKYGFPIMFALEE